jgi:hypothetical protein
VPYRTPTGNRIIAGIQLVIVIAALGFGYLAAPVAGSTVLTVILTFFLILLGIASTYSLITGRSDGDVSVRGLPNPRLTRTIGFAAVVMTAVAFIILAVFGSADEISRTTVLLNGFFGYVFVYVLAMSTIAQAQLMRERQLQADHRIDGGSASDSA